MIVCRGQRAKPGPGEHAGTGFMHESFDPNAPEQFTRSWFAWANSMFGELIYRLYENGTLQTVLCKAASL